MTGYEKTYLGHSAYLGTRTVYYNGRQYRSCRDMSKMLNGAMWMDHRNTYMCPSTVIHHQQIRIQVY